MSIELSSKKEELIVRLKNIRDNLRRLAQFDELAKKYEERLVGFDVEKDEALIGNKTLRFKKENEIKLVEQRIEERKNKIEKNKSTKKSSISSNKRQIAKNVFLVIFLLFGLALAAGILFLLLDGNSEIGFFKAVGIFAVVIVAIILLFVVSISLGLSKAKTKENKDLMDAAARSTAYEEKAIEEDKAKLEGLKKSLSELESPENIVSRCDAAKAEYEKEMRPKLDKNLADRDKISAEIEGMSGLDRRDWAHIELIVYLLETGRADDLKEALQLVDREVQTRNILAGVESSNNRVVKVFGEGIAAVGKQIQLSTEIQTELMSEQSKILVQMANEAQMARQHLADANAKLADMRTQQLEQIAILGKIAADTQKTAYNTGLTAANTAEIATHARVGSGVTYVPDSKYYPYV